MSTNRRRRVAVGFDDDVHGLLEEMAYDEGRSVADVVKGIVLERVLGMTAEGIGDTARRLILEGLPDEEVLARTLEAHPGASTSRASIRWYRSNMRKDGLDVPSQVEARRRWQEGA
ncbi:MAG: hypothetical protein AAGK21_04015 [Bacteroidota bacterium]